MGKEIQFEVSQERFGPFAKYLEDENVTDLDFNNNNLWVTDLRKGTYMANETISPIFLSKFISDIANETNSSFNQSNEVLEADTEDLRINMIHESVTQEVSISIRRTPSFVRNTIGTMISSNYCSKKILSFMINTILAGMTGLMCGGINTGKTELLKFLTQYIKDEDKVVFIEEKREIHYSSFKKNASSTSIKLTANIDYRKAIKTALQHNAKWLILTEIRGDESKDFIEAASAGIPGLTTLHLKDLRTMPDRILTTQAENENEQITNRVYEYINWAALIKTYKLENGGIGRKIDQICVYWREKEKNNMFMILDDGTYNFNLPDFMRKKFESKGIEDPFSCEIVEKFFRKDVSA